MEAPSRIHGQLHYMSLFRDRGKKEDRGLPRPCSRGSGLHFGAIKAFIYIFNIVLFVVLIKKDVERTFGLSGG